MSKAMIFLICAAFVSAGFGGWQYWNYRKRQNIQSKDELIYNTCKETIKKGLKAPGTAKFAPATETFFNKDGDVYTVTSHVDSQNSFGAFIRGKIICKVRGSNGSYETIYAGLSK